MTPSEAEERLMLSRVALEQLIFKIDNGHIPVEDLGMVTDEIQNLEYLAVYLPEQPRKVEVVARAYIAIRDLIKSVVH